MKKKLTNKETVMIASMLFGMFFGAGNLIFPIHMGQLAGRNIFMAIIGFIITGVGLPILGVAALGSSHCDGLYEMASKVSRRYGMIFTCALYLTIGPLFAIPRCATTAFTVGLPSLSESRAGLAVFSALFFGAVLLFSLKPGKIMVWIGKYLNPIFLILFGSLILIALIHPMASIADVSPDSTYLSGVFLNGFLEGYNTMDALAGLAFGIIVIDSIRELGVEDSDAISSSTIRAGILCGVLMSVIYLCACIIGAQSLGGYDLSENGGIALSQIAEHYLGNIGKLFLAATVTLACLKSAIGLLTSISKTFSEMFTGKRHYKEWALGFCIFSFAVSNVGLNELIKISLPVLEFLYPLAIVLILLNLAGEWFGEDQRVYAWTTGLTMAGGVYDLMTGHSFAWILPALIGFVAGLGFRSVNRHSI